MAIPHLIMAGLMNRYSNDWPSHKAIGWFCVALICTYPLPFTLYPLDLRIKLTKYQMPTPSHTQYPTAPSPGSYQQRYSRIPNVPRVSAPRLQ